MRELKCVFDQIHKDLLQAYLVSNDQLGQWHGVDEVGTCKNINAEFWARQRFHGFKGQLRLLQLGLLVKDADDEFECFSDVEFFFPTLELVLVKHLQVQDVINKVKKQVYLRDHH